MRIPQPRTLSLESPPLRLAAQGVGVALLTLVVVYVLSGRELPLLTAALAGLFCLWLFRNPHWGVLAIFTFWFIRFSPQLLGSRYLLLSYIISVLLCVPLALRLLRDREVWVWHVPHVKYLLAIGALFLISSLWADYKYPVTFLPELDRTFENGQNFVTHFVFLVFFLYFVNTRKKILIFIWLAILLILASVGSAYITLFSVSAWRRANASFGVGTNPTSFPYVSLFGASLLWCYYSAAPTKRWKGWVLPFLAAIPVMAIASGSRTGLLQLAVFATLVFRDRSGSWSRTQRIRGLLLIACVVIMVSLLVPAIAVLRSTSFETSPSAPGGHSLHDRLNTISAAVGMIASDPVLGVGIGNFLWINAAAHGFQTYPHNSYLWAFSEGGIGVLVLYLILLYATYRMLRQLEAAGPPDLVWVAKGLRFNLILLLVFGLSDDVFLTDLFYLLLASTSAMFRLWQMQLQSYAPARYPIAQPYPPVESRR